MIKILSKERPAIEPLDSDAQRKNKKARPIIFVNVLWGGNC